LSRRQRGGLSRRQQQEELIGCGALALVALVALSIGYPLTFLPIDVVLLGAIFFVYWLRRKARLQAEEERRELERRWEAERQERARQRAAAEAAKRRRIEAMLHPDRVRDEIHYVSGLDFERFMADVLRQKGYEV
jgi:hypothetical protein